MRTITASTNLAILLSALFAATAANAQGLESDRIVRLAQECSGFVRDAVSFEGSGELGMAAVHLDMAADSCTEAASLIESGASTAAERQRTRLFHRLLEPSLETIVPLAERERCALTAEYLEALAGLVEDVPDEDVESFEALAVAVLSCEGPRAGDSVTVALNASFGELTLNSVATGEISTASADACPGAVPSTPQFLLEVSEPLSVRLEIASAGPSLVYRLESPGQVTCDYADVVGSIEIPLSPGTHRLFVGQLVPDVGTEFNLAISAYGSPGVQTPRLGVVEVSPEMSPLRRAGSYQGTFPLETLSASRCTGFTTEEPAFRLEVSEETSLWATMLPDGDSAEGELRLLIVGDGFTQCASSSAEGPPGMEVTLPVGTYGLYLGADQTWAFRYALFLTARDPGASGMGEPLGGAHTVSLDTPLEVVGETVGEVPASLRVGPACVGFVSQVPTLAVTVSEAGQYALTVESTRDTTLGLVGDGTVRCNDDFGGDNPGLFLQLEPGDYDVFIGDWGVTSRFRFRMEHY
ncbi:MAG: hypothetical protein KC561_12310 [Myxococcales bacterium]|nr:hypothetical protein [Myxococcales bacterium]